MGKCWPSWPFWTNPEWRHHPGHPERHVRLQSQMRSAIFPFPFTFPAHPSHTKMCYCTTWRLYAFCHDHHGSRSKTSPRRKPRTTTNSHIRVDPNPNKTFPQFITTNTNTKYWIFFFPSASGSSVVCCAIPPTFPKSDSRFFLSAVKDFITARHKHRHACIQ